MTTELQRREFEEYRKADKAAQDVLDAAAAEGRDLTPEEDEQFNRAFESARGHKTRMDKLGEMDENRSAVEALIAAHVGQPADPKSGESTSEGGFDTRLLASIHATVGDFKRTEAYGVERGDVVGFPDLEKRAIADFSDNGALYTTDFSTNVAVYQRTASPWIDLAFIINADNGRPPNLPNLTVDPTTYAPGEGTAITESTPTIGSAALTTTAYKDLAYVSAEAEDDELIGLLPLIARVQGRSIGLKFGSDLSAALISAMNNGGTASGVGGVGTATSAFFGYEDLIDLKYGRQAPYRKSGVWVMANSAIKKVRKFHDQNGLYYFNAASNPQDTDSFDGNPVYEDPFLAAAASASKSVVFGDAGMVVVKQMPLRVATSMDFRFNQDQVALKTVYRAGGALPDVTALAYLVSANS